MKKIFERDDTPAKVLVLCVSAVIGLPQSLTSSGIQTSKVSSGAGDGQKPAPSTVRGFSYFKAIKYSLTFCIHNPHLVEKHKFFSYDHIILRNSRH